MKRYISKSQCKLCILSLKYVPIICVLLMLLHIIFSLLGFNLCISEMSILTLCSIMVLVWTHCFKFCLIHKLYTIYVLVGSIADVTTGTTTTKASTYNPLCGCTCIR